MHKRLSHPVRGYSTVEYKSSWCFARRPCLVCSLLHQMPCSSHPSASLSACLSLSRRVNFSQARVLSTDLSAFALLARQVCVAGGVGSAEGCAVTLDTEPGLLHLLQEGFGKFRACSWLGHRGVRGKRVRRPALASPALQLGRRLLLVDHLPLGRRRVQKG